MSLFSDVDHCSFVGALLVWLRTGNCLYDILNHNEVVRLLAEFQAFPECFGVHHRGFGDLSHCAQVQSLREEKEMRQQSSNVWRDHRMRLLGN